MGDDTATATTATATTNTYAVSSIHKDVLRSICHWIFPPESPPAADTTATATVTDNNTNTNAATDTNAAAETTAEESKLRPREAEEGDPGLQAQRQPRQQRAAQPVAHGEAWSQ